MLFLRLVARVWFFLLPLLFYLRVCLFILCWAVLFCGKARLLELEDWREETCSGVSRLNFYWWITLWTFNYYHLRYEAVAGKEVLVSAALCPSIQATLKRCTFPPLELTWKLVVPVCSQALGKGVTRKNKGTRVLPIGPCVLGSHCLSLHHIAVMFPAWRDGGT